MISIIPYDEKYNEAVRQISEQKLRELSFHGDVLRESRILALDQDRVLGFGYLVCDGNYRLPPGKVQGNCFLAPEYQAKDEDPAREVEASALLLCSLMNSFDELCEQRPEYSLVLRTWCGSKKKAYLEFLESFGFSAADSMLVYSKDLKTDEAIPDKAPENSGMENGMKVLFREGMEIFFREDRLEDQSRQEEYLKARGRAFGTHESREDLMYRLSDPAARLFTAEYKGRIIAGITTWRTSGIVSEEGIFCVPELRRRGIGEALVQHVHNTISKDGISQVILAVYKKNQSAVRFYKRLGYRLMSEQTELHYKPERRTEQ